MDSFPAFFPLAGRTVVIAGEGEMADAKTRLFEGSPATVKRLVGGAAFDPQAYQDAALVFVATPDDDFAAGAAAAARLAGAPVNVTDRPALCDFTTPAIVDRGEVVAAIGTGGASPMLATLLRHDLEVRIPAGAGHIAALFRDLQAELRQALPELHHRRAFLRAALVGPVAQAALAGEGEAAASLLRQALANHTASAGEIFTLSGRGPVGDLTLREAARLAAADVLVCDEGVDPHILAIARRDAVRLAPPQDLNAVAADGRIVVRLTA